MSLILDDGPFTYRDAERGGLTDRRLHELCASGQLLRPHRGIYLPAHLDKDLDARAASFARVLPPGAAIARESAAWLMGVDVRPPGRWQEPPTLECVVPLGATRPVRPDVSAFISSLPPDDVVIIGGLPCTTPTRTALDLARYRPRFVGLGAVDALAHAGLTSVSDLREGLATLGGHRFVKRARQVVELCDPRAESAGESWCRLRLHEAGLPPTGVQISLCDHTGREIYRLDMGYVEEQIGVDYDGVEHHLRTPEQRRRDDARELDVQRRFGWTLARAGSVDVLGRQPHLEGAVMGLLGISREFRRRSWND
ncbi:type IV toxin-antitoxin system AbiEi family antitoxin domain-containing protein [Georgenia sunbinii]|uniref:type IV toxin-antitoxin system AbiEi family antitoxin domain-containing protein n=1 Tax=Georgenia sunbinii TaxID=3117728 RepID=UPI002F262D97